MPKKPRKPRPFYFSLLILLLLGYLPQTQAAVQVSTQFDCDQVLSIQVPGVVGVLSSGQSVICVKYPSEYARIGDQIQLGLTLIGPGVITTVGTMTVSQSFAGTGCTGTTITSGSVTAVSTTTTATQTYAYTLNQPNEDLMMNIGQPLTTTGKACSGVWHVFINVSTTVGLLYVDIPINAHALQNQAQYTFLCAATATTVLATDPVGSTCNTPTMNNAITGTLTLSGTINAVVSGTLDELTRICAASPTGTTCNVATINSNSNFTVGTLNQTNIFPSHVAVDVSSTGWLGSVTGPGFQWWLELLMWIGIFWFCYYFRSMYILTFAIGGVFHLISQTWVFGLDKSLPLIGLGFLLEWFVSRNRREREVKPLG